MWRTSNFLDEKQNRADAFAMCQPRGILDSGLRARLQCPHKTVDIKRRMRILFFEGCGKAPAYLDAVFVVGGQEHDDELGGAAPCDDIAFSQGRTKMLFQIVHGSHQAVRGNRSVLAVF